MGGAVAPEDEDDEDERENVFDERTGVDSDTIAGESFDSSVGKEGIEAPPTIYAMKFFIPWAILGESALKYDTIGSTTP